MSSCFGINYYFDLFMKRMTTDFGFRKRDLDSLLGLLGLGDGNGGGGGGLSIGGLLGG